MEGERILKELLKKKLGGLYDDTKVIYEEIVKEFSGHIFGSERKQSTTLDLCVLWKNLL